MERRDPLPRPATGLTAMTTTFTTDPTGEHHDGLPTYIWREAPEGLATRRQLSEQGLRRNGQDPAAQIRRGRYLFAYLYRVDLAAPKRPFTEAKREAVRRAVQARRRCDTCQRTDLTYIPRQAAPCWGRCWDCMGLDPTTDREHHNGDLGDRVLLPVG